MRQTYDLNWHLEEHLLESDETIKPMTFNERLEMLRGLIFNFDYGIDEEFRPQFERGFCSHFLFKEIGFGTFTRWHFELQAHLNVHGVRYNNLYQAELKDITDAIDTINIENLSETEQSGQVQNMGQGTSEGQSENFSINRSSDTPQGRTEVDGNYLSGLADAKQVGTNESTSVENSEQSQTSSSTGRSTTKGFSGMTRTQLNRMYAEQMVVANEVVFYNFEKLFLQSVI